MTKRCPLQKRLCEAALKRKGSHWPHNTPAKTLSALTPASWQGFVEVTPRVSQIDREWHPPDQIVREAHHCGCGRPRTAHDENPKADGAEDFSGQPDGGDEPTVFRATRDFNIEYAVEPYDHAEASEQ